MSRPTSQQVRELAQFYATEGDAYGHLAEDLAREAARFEVEEAAFEERVDALAPVVWGELTKHDPNTWPEMSVHSLEGAADVARVVLVWLDAQEPESAAVPESWATWQEVPAGVMYRARSGVGTWVNNGGIRLATIDWEPSTYTEARMRCLAPFVRADG